MDDNGLPPLPGTQSTGSPPSPSASEGQSSDQSSGTAVPEPVVSAPVDNVILPPLPVPGDTVSPAISDTVTQESSVKQEPPTTLPPSEPEKPKKKSNMKVVAGLMVALFLIGSAITSLVMFPNFRGDIRPKARDIEEVEQYMEQQTQETVQMQQTDVAYQEVPYNPQPTDYVDNPPPPYTPPSTEDNNYSGDSSGNNNSGGGTGGGGGGGNECEVVRQCPDGSTRSVCESCPTVATTTPTYGQQVGCSIGDSKCENGIQLICRNTGWEDSGHLCRDNTPSGNTPSVTSCPTECCGTQTRCVGGYLDLCSGGQFYSSQRPCSDPTATVTTAPGVGGTGGGGAKECVPNQCHRRNFGKRDGSMCDANGNNTGVWCDMGDTGEGTGEINTCGCVDGEVAGQSGPYMCWVKNGSTGAFIRQLGETITKSGCKGSGVPSVTTSVTASVTTGGGSSSGGSSSSSSGGSSSSSSSSSGGVTAMCVETRVYLKKADGTFDTVATPVSQLSSKVSIGNTIRLAIRGNLANFTKGRFIIKKDGTVLETKETTTKNNLPGDPATFEYIYDYTVASGGSYSIEGAVWQ